MRNFALSRREFLPTVERASPRAQAGPLKVSKTTKKVGKKKIVTRFAQALDDGFPVPTTTFRIGGRTYHANALGKAKVPAGSGKAAAPGYVGASFRVR